MIRCQVVCRCNQSAMIKYALLIFAKNPEEGKVKTRLAKTLGVKEAISIYQELIASTIAVTEELPIEKFVCYSDEISQADSWGNEHYNKVLQKGNDLGARMKNACQLIFQKGFSKCVIIGTDCPELTQDIIMDAFMSDIDEPEDWESFNIQRQ